MKRTMIALAVLFLFGISAYAETDTKASEQDHTGQGHQMMMCPKMQQMHGQGMAQGGMKCPMMQQHGQGMMQGGMMCPKMGQMMGHGMMARDMMQMMTDMLKMQQKMLRGLSAVEKKEMTAEIDKMMDKMEKMMSDSRGMMMRGMGDMQGGMMGHGMMGGGMAPQVEPEKGVTEPAKEPVPKSDPHKH
jgi:hypothetical protein